MSAEMTTSREPAGGAPGPREFAADYRAKLTTAEEAMSQVADGSTLAMGLSPCQPPALLRALADRARAKNINGVKVYYSVSGRHLRNTILRFEHLRRFEPYCLFFGATERELAARARAEGRGKIINYVPNFFYELDRCIPEHRTVDTFMTTVAPMDDEGYFSFGTNSDYSCVLSRRSTRVVVEVNKHMPAVRGPAPIHVSEVAAIVENDTPLEEFPVAPPKELDPLDRAQRRRADSRRRHAADGHRQPAERRLQCPRPPQRSRHPHRAADAADGEADGEGDRQQPVQEARHRQDDLHLRARRSRALRVHERPSRHRGPAGVVRERPARHRRSRIGSCRSTPRSRST